MKNSAKIKGDNLHITQDENGNVVTQQGGYSKVTLNGKTYINGKEVPNNGCAFLSILVIIATLLISIL